MTRTILLAALLLLATGCGVVQRMRPARPMLISTFEARCASVPFVSYGSCMRSELGRNYPKWRSDPHADLVDVYLAWLDAAGARVSDGRMTEPDARLGAAEMKLRLKQIAGERAANASVQQDAAMSRMLTGLALLQMGQPQPVYAPPAARGPITCTQYPTNTVYGQTQVVCD